MTTFALSDLIEELTPEQVEATLYRGLTTIGIRHTQWAPDDDLRVMLKVTSVLFAYGTLITAGIARSGFLATTTSLPWLKIKARYDFNVEPNEETFAVGPVTFTNAASIDYTISAGDMVVSGAGKEFEIEENFIIPAAGSTAGSVTVVCRAKEIGAASSVEAGVIDTLVTPLPGVSVANTTRIIGQSEETLAALKLRCASKMQTLSVSGPRGAYRYVCTSARRSDNTPIEVTKFRAIADGLGGVDIYLGSSSGALAADDLAIVQSDVWDQAEPMAIDARVANAPVLLVPIEFTAYVYASLNLANEAISSLIADSVQARFTRAPVGGDVFDAAQPGIIAMTSITSAIQDASPKIPRVVLTLPPADVVMQPNQNAVPVITPHIVVIPDPEGTI